MIYDIEICVEGIYGNLFFVGDDLKKNKNIYCTLYGVFRNFLTG